MGRMRKIELREASVKDLSAVLSLYSQPDMDNGQVLPVKQALEVFRRIKSYPNYKIYVATSEGEIIGTFALLIMDHLGHKGVPSGIVEDVVVKKDWQGKGVGRQMMQYAMDRCKEMGCYKLALSSNIKREAAHLFYESLGFRKHGYSFVVEPAKENESSDV